MGRGQREMRSDAVRIGTDDCSKTRISSRSKLRFAQANRAVVPILRAELLQRDLATSKIRRTLIHRNFWPSGLDRFICFVGISLRRRWVELGLLIIHECSGWPCSQEDPCGLAAREAPTRRNSERGRGKMTKKIYFVNRDNLIWGSR